MAEVTDDERGPRTPDGSAPAAEESGRPLPTDSAAYDHAILVVYLSSQGVDRVELADDFGSYHGDYIWDDESILAFAVVTAVVHAIADPSGSAKSVAFALNDYLHALADPLVRVPFSFEVREYLERTAPLEVAWVGRVSSVEREEERGDHRLDWVTAGERPVPPPRVLAETLLQHWARTAARDSADHAALIAALEAARLWTTAAEQDRAGWSEATRTAIAVSLWRLARKDRPEPTKPAAWLEAYEDQGFAEDEQL